MSLLRIILRFFFAKKSWKKPKHSKFLVLDSVGSLDISNILGFVDTIAIRGESYNIYILMKLVLNRRFWSKKYVDLYCDEYIKTTKPEWLITFIDNNLYVYNVKNRFPWIKVAVIQNGNRDDWLSKIKSKDHWKVDYFFCFNDAIGKYYSQHIQIKSIPIGSLRSNNIPIIKMPKNKDTVLFVSQFEIKSLSKDYYINSQGQHFNYLQFYRSEQILLKIIKKWCLLNKNELLILGRSKPQSRSEYNFFHSILGDDGWHFLDKNEIANSYLQVDMAGIVVSIDSTLGYEAISRGNKTAFFCNRSKQMNSVDRSFGWPIVFPQNGRFWSNSCSEDKIYSVMNYLNNVSDFEWQKQVMSLSKKLMSYDSGNSIIKSIMSR